MYILSKVYKEVWFILVVETSPNQKTPKPEPRTTARRPNQLTRNSMTIHQTPPETQIMSTSIIRTIKNVYRSGIKRAAWQVAFLNDTKPGGVLVGTDDYGNKYYETDAEEEIHLRTRWVEYNATFLSIDISKAEPGWHYWLGYGTNTPPNLLPEDQKAHRAYPLPEKHKPMMTGTRGAYVPYSTAKPKFQPWQPVVNDRS